MSRKYAELWRRISKNEKQSIICPAKGEKAIRAAIYNEKYWHQKARGDTDLPAFGRINIQREELKDRPGQLRLTISIAWSGDNL